MRDVGRRFIALDTALFADGKAQRTTHDSPFPVEALGFADDSQETTWIMDDLRSDRSAQDGGPNWGDVALLYRTHKIGSALESAFLNAGVPCCLAQGRALADDKVVAYVLAALRVIANPRDEIHQEMFYQAVLPDAVFDSARAWAEETGRSLIHQIDQCSLRAASPCRVLTGGALPLARARTWPVQDCAAGAHSRLRQLLPRFHRHRSGVVGQGCGQRRDRRVGSGARPSWPRCRRVS